MSLIGRDELLKDWLEEDKIFVRDTWSPENVRGASYDLRVSTDWLILPDGRRCSPGNGLIERPFVLHPGQMAAVGSREAFFMSWDVGAAIAPKFSTVQQGLLVLHGGVIDPGYGQRDGDDDPEGPGERLFVWVANVGAEPIAIEPGRRSLLRITFFRVAELLRPHRQPVTVPAELKDEFRRPKEAGGAEEPTAGLAFFTDARKVRTELDTFRAQTQTVIIGGAIVLALAVLGMLLTILVALIDIEKTQEPSWKALVMWALSCGTAIFLAVRLGAGRGPTLRDRWRAAWRPRLLERPITRRLEKACAELDWATSQARLADEARRRAVDQLADARSALDDARVELERTRADGA